MQPINTLCVQNVKLFLLHQMVHIVTIVFNGQHSCVHYSSYVTPKEGPTTHTAQSRQYNPRSQEVLARLIQEVFVNLKPSRNKCKSTSKPPHLESPGLHSQFEMLLM
jgi:hypothetical protein